MYPLCDPKVDLSYERGGSGEARAKTINGVARKSTLVERLPIVIVLYNGPGAMVEAWRWSRPDDGRGLTMVVA